MGCPGSRDRGIVLVFALCALTDFVWSYVKGRSIIEAVVSAVLGLFGTAWYLFLLSRFDRLLSLGKDASDSGPPADDSHRLLRRNS
jgi:hypothetical protein